MKYKSTLIALATAILVGGCEKSTGDVDTTYPEIVITDANAFPKQCSVVKRGEAFTFRASFSDDVELGACSIDIHHNFDHHSHSTEVNNCGFEPVKTPVNPYLLIKTFAIPGGQKSYTINEQLIIPAGADSGDYHFLIRITDKTGWQTIKGLSIKVL